MYSSNYLSVFKPSDIRSYKIIDSKINEPTVILSSPPPLEVVKEKSAKPITTVIKERKTKKYWSTEQKKLAVEKAKILGLSKATKYLQVTYPGIYSDLSPSTLQYWIHKNNPQILSI
ncbi:hypothetical protein EHI8A_108990 [Entamoeba histolytica HM-1:IMSS-B]|uniref:Uncharacterized protein n=6 Tax=Entamoeba histolytica TaxID=5759 RepID=C4M2N8_ENTH1|nr:hypothetical protein EHI_006040 [Entamoeba histolytica HM-1:IMSS]EMD48058.1 Hypothetical protein EHI5A_034650 [Entamoeba histolytica KU27]EMH74513.1 hypothetical protein EHI8A_108990 [Entamoeba histolytica HM-1:IMSS-B]EMS11508.1 hypothetical protein KM1_043000 [Entamoeba histolytica HM-3:IMSS]ENY63173.1 hypothetical protein EHI7A_017790 [Entamoeba histolytica HM-1:IMSS-A]GAT95547.1 hypothetical protein CL6EHI_006040 [Entamoeba histolytica]|eukprot:XP_653427.1 hypothetical protein EHI_006040 [Entamoeba histolytica HM-1:IMSS]